MKTVMLHLKKKHGLEGEDAKEALGFLPDFEHPKWDDSDFPTPPEDSDPIHALDVVDMWRCLECGLLTKNKHVLYDHYRYNHRAAKARGSIAQGTLKAQCWFPNTRHRQWFVVGHPKQATKETALVLGDQLQDRREPGEVCSVALCEGTVSYR